MWLLRRLDWDRGERDRREREGDRWERRQSRKIRKKKRWKAGEEWRKGEVQSRREEKRRGGWEGNEWRGVRSRGEERRRPICGLLSNGCNHDLHIYLCWTADKTCPLLNESPPPLWMEGRYFGLKHWNKEAEGWCVVRTKPGQWQMFGIWKCFFFLIYYLLAVDLYGSQEYCTAPAGWL